jgi:folate-dependent phosphoribosylglycinamide formyltransferase PurN
MRALTVATNDTLQAVGLRAFVRRIINTHPALLPRQQDPAQSALRDVVAHLAAGDLTFSGVLESLGV